MRLFDNLTGFIPTGATATQRAMAALSLNLSSLQEAYNASVPPAEWPRITTYHQAKWKRKGTVGWKKKDGKSERERE